MKCKICNRKGAIFLDKEGRICDKCYVANQFASYGHISCLLKRKALGFFSRLKERMSR